LAGQQIFFPNTDKRHRTRREFSHRQWWSSNQEKKKKEKRNLEGIVSSVCAFDIGTVPQMIGNRHSIRSAFLGGPRSFRWRHTNDDIKSGTRRRESAIWNDQFHS
jgi:hypothetical protein